MLISEIFMSRIGEGSNIGKEAIFIRLFGCSKQCTFCDTPQGKEPQQANMELSVADLVVRAHDLRKETGISLVVVTGGEPGEQYAQLNDLVRELTNRGFYLYLETNGEHKGLLYHLFTLVTVCPKSNNLAWDKLHQSLKLEFKFLHDVDHPEDSLMSFNGVTQTIRQRYGFVPPVTIQIMDKNYTIEEQLMYLRKLIEKNPYRLENDMDSVRLLPQLHKLLKIR